MRVGRFETVETVDVEYAIPLESWSPFPSELGISPSPTEIEVEVECRKADEYARKFWSLIDPSCLDAVDNRGKCNDRLTYFKTPDKRSIAIYGPRRDLFCLGLRLYHDLQLEGIQDLLKSIAYQPLSFQPKPHLSEAVVSRVLSNLDFFRRELGD